MKESKETEGALHRRSWKPPLTTSTGVGVAPESMERSDHDFLPDETARGALMPPTALGRQLSHTDSMMNSKPPSPKVVAHPATIRARQRTKSAILRAQSAVATVFQEGPMSKLTSFTYQGMEVTFGTTNGACFGFCSRTRLVFQQLDVDDDIVSIHSHPLSGQVVIVQQNGCIRTYLPEPTNPTETSFGRFRWWNGPSTKCSSIFYENADMKELDLSLSADYRILVAHQSQLAVLDATPFVRNAAPKERRSVAELLWTTRLPGKVLMAELSGDGESIALVLESEEDDAAADGVHTFERDHDDGASPVKEQQGPTAAALQRSRSVGIVYKPGPFLVHSTPVTRISFRGLGHDTSNVSDSDEQGSDLLLTYCGQNNTAKVFTQNNWRALTEWMTPPRTRVDWVRGISAFTLGDLESQKKPKSSASQPPSRVQSYNSLTEAESINASLGKRLHYQSIPSHATPSSNAGAWIAELTFYGATPAIRLSRLTYLKRGMDDLNPTMFENVSSFVVPGLLFENPLLTGERANFSVEGIWPAWNPWLSESVETDHSNETLRGSAMAFLGLSSGPGVMNAGHFGDSLLGSTQNPPCEVRVVASHPSSGLLVMLEFPLLGDQDWTALELGSPRKSILKLSDLACTSSSPIPELASSMHYESSRLIAQVHETARIVSISWQKQGTLSLLPSNWLPEDVDPSKTVKILKEKRWFKDDSLVPVPLALPSVFLPAECSEDDTIVAVAWWPDNHFGTPPLLVALTASGTVIIFELPPPWSSHEPISLRSEGPSPVLLNGGTHFPPQAEGSVEGSQHSTKGSTYDIFITPHPEYGLGLRLEVQQDGMPAVAGSFKRHPLNNDILPAEKAGLINLGDELISANEIVLEDKRFEDIIATVRDLGANCGPGNPMRLKFRRKMTDSQPWLSDQPRRRTMEEIIGIKPSYQSMDDHKAAVMLQLKREEGKVQEFGTVVGLFADAVPKSTKGHSHFSLLPCDPKKDATAYGSKRSATLFHCAGSVLTILGVTIDLCRHDVPPDFQTMGTWDTAESCVGAHELVKMDVVKIEDEDFCIALCDDEGRVDILIASTDGDEVLASRKELRFQHFQAFRLDNFEPERIILRLCSIDLIATMQMSEEMNATEITVWSAVPLPGSDTDDVKETDDGAKPNEYFPSSIKADVDDSFHNFAFVRTGFMDSSASIATFSERKSTLFSRQAGSRDWLPTIQIAYQETPGSSLVESPVERRPSLHGGITLARSSINRLPHLLPSMLLAYSSSDEADSLRSDWHPESLLCHIFADGQGTEEAIGVRVRDLLLWLCAESKDVPEDFVQGPLVVAPMPVLDESSGENKGVSKQQTHVAPLSGTESKENGDIEELLSLVSSYCSNMDSALGVDLPPMLRSFGLDDMHILRACCEVLLDPPNFDKVDHCGQHYLASVAIMNKLRDWKEPNQRSSSSSLMYGARVLVKNSSSKGDQNDELRAVASSGCLAALMSRNQSHIVDRCKRMDRPLDWVLARELRVPFWLRSDKALARLSEEIGQCMFREKRDIMECALFFIIARKMRTLRNLAATDQSDNGRKFFKFLTSHDFSSERGRRAAEKNAFSLLRKCRYTVAASFFLLAEPPALNSAIETLATKSKDLDLAYLVARLVESDELEPSSSGAALGVGGFGGMLGGGGGYATPGVVQTFDTVDEDSSFDEWAPNLGKAAKKLLISRSLPMSSDDSSLSALQLLWLGKKEEAAWVLSGLVHTDGRATAYTTSPQIADRFFGRQLAAWSKRSGLSRAMEKTNSIIDFVSTPSLLTAMKSSARPRFASSLTVAGALIARGLELSSIKMVLQNTDLHEPEEKENIADKVDGEASATHLSDPAQTNSSIFDSYDAPKKQPVQSSIFDSYDVPVARTRPAESNGELQSSIFDSFDVPAPKTQTVKPAPGGDMSSSIFADFDVPVPKPKPPASSGEMASSIFADFDVPPPKPKPLPAPAATTMESSIFADFDVPAPKQKPSAANPQGEMESSIFDSFGTAPASKTASSVVSMQSAATTDSTTQQAGDGTKPQSIDDEVPDIGLHVAKTPTPTLWLEWRKSLLSSAAARRLTREVASVLAQFDGDPPDRHVSDFYRSDDPLIPSGASGILQLPCDADHILSRIRQSLNELSSATGLDPKAITEEAMRLLGPTYQQHRMLFTVLLHIVSGRYELAEDAIRQAAFDLMQICFAFSFSNDHLVHKRRSKYHVSSQFIRRKAARTSWLLETCLWLHRGGGLPLSGVALKEAVTAVRVGLIIASWNHNHECLEAMLRSDPDVHLNEDAGRHIWTSLKMITSSSHKGQEGKKTSSGGWEFLVDCRRSEATQILKEKRTGCFIIRPHARDHGVFTLSFKTNLVPAADSEQVDRTPETSGDELSDPDIANRAPKQKSKAVKKDDVVQHAIIRLSESGYRCGSFGPYTTLIDLLEAVSDSLPFKLRFDLPPSNRVIKEEGSQPSPNAVFFRKLALSHADSLVSNAPTQDEMDVVHSLRSIHRSFSTRDNERGTKSRSLLERQTSFGLFLELLVLSAMRKQLSRVVTGEYEDLMLDDSDSEEEIECLNVTPSSSPTTTIKRASTFLYDRENEAQDMLADAFRILSPLLTWCRSLEVLAAVELSPNLKHLEDAIDPSPVDLAESTGAIEAAPHSIVSGMCGIDGGDALLRKMIQRDSGVDFSTLRLVDGGDCTVVVLFSQNEAIKWLVASGIEETEADAMSRLQRMEKKRVIEPIDLSRLPLKQKAGVEDEGVRYRILDPWEVEALQNWEGETLGASLGREKFLGFNLGKVGLASENIFRSLGGLPLLALWTSTKGGVVLTKALATAHPPWERSAGGDLQFANGVVSEPVPFENSIRQHLYRNALFRRLDMPQRFLALVQVELLDLKNLITPGGALNLSVYALLRLKREGSSAALTNKARTLDTAATQPVKLGKSSGPNAPASWGSVVRFRFPLPEDASADGVSYDNDREMLFKGPPCVLQVSVYEKKLLVDYSLGTADIPTDGLWAGGQLEEWVPLRSEKHGIAWFARIRLTLRFELMCVANDDESSDLATAAPSVGLRKINELSVAGSAAHEDVRRSVSSPDLLSYFESMVYHVD